MGARVEHLELACMLMGAYICATGYDSKPAAYPGSGSTYGAPAAYPGSSSYGSGSAYGAPAA
eukprot:1172399-Prorocentrum_minimum.AAC.1